MTSAREAADSSRIPGPLRLYSASPWGNLSGAPICSLEHLRVLKESVDEICLILCEHGPIEDRARADGISVWCRPFAFRGLRHASGSQFLRRIGEVVRSRWAYVRDLHCLLREKPGILHIHSRAAHLPYALLAGRWARVPLVVTIHEPWAGGWEARSELWMIRWLADRVVFLTHAMVGQYPQILKGVDVIYNYFPLLPERPAPDNQCPVVVMVGQMVKAKGTDLFLQTCLRLKESGVVFEAWMVGNWLNEADREQAEQFIRENNLNGVVSILGVQSHMEIIYKRMDVLLLPTRRDSFPRVVMEAMSYGIPVVATRVDGIPEMVEEGATGLLVEPEDTADFAQSVRRLLEDPGLRLRMGRAGKERAALLFSPQTYVNTYRTLYRDLPSRPGRR